MSRLTGRGFTNNQSDAFVARSSQPHTVQWKADVHRFSDGSNDLIQGDLPIVGGSLVLDSSDPIRRQLTIEVGGGNEVVPENAADPLVPFGQTIYLFLRIDLANGTWSPWLKMGEFPITSYVYERPTDIATVEAADYSHLVNEFRHLTKHGYGNQSLQHAIVDMVEKAIPSKTFNVVAADSARDRRVTNYAAEAGSGRWDTATDLAQIKGHEVFFDADGNLVIRRDVTDDNDDVIPGTGPDIGTAANPVATLKDGTDGGGNLVALTATITREGGCNGVVINIHETANQRRSRKNGTGTVPNPGAGDDRRNVQVEAYQNTGPAAWGNTFGRIPQVIERNVHTITDQVVADQRSRAHRLLHRRRGVVRYIDLDVAGVYWLEPDDKVRVKWANRVEYHFAQRVEFDLSGRSPIRVRTRQLAVTDPGASPGGDGGGGGGGTTTLDGGNAATTTWTYDYAGGTASTTAWGDTFTGGMA